MKRNDMGILLIENIKHYLIKGYDYNYEVYIESRFLNHNHSDKG
jgi:retron-type reverse transcriptase